MTGQQRVLAALRCEEPDCVPYCEIGIDPAMAARLCGWDATADVERGDIDEAFNIEESPYTAEQAVALADHLYLDNLYYVMRAPVFTDKRAGKHGRLFYGDGRIASVADVEAMQLPDPHDPAALARAREFLAAAAGERASFLITRAGIFPTVLSLGWEPFSYALYDDRELLAAMLPHIGLAPPQEARLLWVRDTKTLDEVECGEVYREEARARPDLEVLTGLRPLPIDRVGDLPAIVDGHPDLAPEATAVTGARAPT